MTDDVITRHVLISGRVQGVGYRAWCRREAEERGLSGWVRNRQNGDVEAVFSGAPEVVEAIILACRKGPGWARVDHVEVISDGAPIRGPFEMRATR
ncbi:acylphosphatase [Rhodobium gokarnense]|uniref:acylphosphatase n=1 Tax=Rhodobium gokarnense TaxID=364296 RepID=A0ABT3H9Y4_9HYPH|nr:acylphosphatase [Rhodobium gokarnense]MCW2307212.1 acylphosphatase [Rhodobium gokarnense]